MAIVERGVSFNKGTTDLGSEMSNLQKKIVSIHILSLLIVGLEILTLLQIKLCHFPLLEVSNLDLNLAQLSI